MKVAITKGTSVDRALKVLKRMLAKEGITREIRKHRSYEKPSITRRRKEKDRLRSLRKAQRERERRFSG